jgi:hypothetical protein
MWYNVMLTAGAKGICNFRVEALTPANERIFYVEGRLCLVPSQGRQFLGEFLREACEWDEGGGVLGLSPGSHDLEL